MSRALPQLAWAPGIGDAARLELALAIADAVEAGQRRPCTRNGDLWFGSLTERAAAARLCDGCPVLRPCRAAGQTEGYGVWGGVDRTPGSRVTA